MNNTVKTSIAVGATAAVLGTGIFFVSDTNEKKLPELNLPTLELASLDLPELPGLETLSLETISLNTESLFETGITTNNVTTAATSIPTTTNISLTMNNLETVNVQELSLTEFANNVLLIPDVMKYAEKLNALRILLTDTRNIDHVFLTEEVIAKWCKIYEEYKDTEPIKYIPCPKGLKIITEVCKINSIEEYDILVSNLKLYKKYGYNSVLINICANDQPADITYLADVCLANDYYPFFTFGGIEKLSDPTFFDPDWMKEMITEVSKKCYGYIPWRRSGLHLFIPDKQYTNFIYSTMRKANPNILIFGEIYYGMTALDHPKIKWWYNVPENCSGVILTNRGYRNVDFESIITNIRVKLNNKNIAIIAQVLGDKPYYLTKNKNRYNNKQNFIIKRRIENELIRAGVDGLITLTDDGSNGIYNEKITNNLTKTKLLK